MQEDKKIRSFWKGHTLFLALFLMVFILMWFLLPSFSPPSLENQKDDKIARTSNVLSKFEAQAIQPIPLHIDLDKNKVVLGERLFHDVRLSGNNTISCASCHDLKRGGTDRSPRSMGINHTPTGVNAPTVFNASFNFKQFWDGRADTLVEQINGPVQNPGEMGATWSEIIKKLKASGEYEQDFIALYSDGLTEANIRDAIATFEQSLYTPNARFDLFLGGNQAELSPIEKQGYQHFLGFGCIRCHQGIGIGGNMFQRMGAKNDYFKARGHETKADLGRYNVTGDDFDRYRFKVPSLRNVALTAPYFHDGSATTLEDAVSTMARFQLARTLTDQELQAIVAFLKTLTGEYQGMPL